MSVIFVNVVLTLMLGVVVYLWGVSIKTVYQRKEYQVLITYLSMFSVLLTVAILVLVDVWVDGLRLLELRGVL